MHVFDSNSSLDIEVAETVFNINPDSYKWGIPSFSKDRNASALINTEMAFRDKKIREKYDKELKTIVARQKGIDPESLSLSLVILLPEKICNAALIACRENNH
ncbi:MAG: hypothetical protein H8D23_29515 [Candidatus Brocadiales bacterium]|nr:hypothetical protein [Candidatus Brocadiales bacterium]